MTFLSRFEQGVFAYRRVWLACFLVMTLVLIYFAAQIKIDAGFAKQLPIEHPYIKNFLKYQNEFGAANRIIIALENLDGDIYQADFLQALQQATDAVFFIQGVDRPSVTSLFTPNVRYIEVVEEGFAGGNVAPADFKPTPEHMERLRANVLKADLVGRLVASDFKGALIRASLLEVDPVTGNKVDYRAISEALEKIRADYSTDTQVVHIIGFAKVVGDIADAGKSIVMFFAVAFIITALLLFLYSGNVALTLLPLFCSLLAVVWQLGLLSALGYGIDPMSILLPFLIFAIGVSHGVQMINGILHEDAHANPMAAARASFRRLLLPGLLALASDTLGFLTIHLIEIPIIQEFAITASLGVGMIILSNLFLLPLLAAGLPGAWLTRLPVTAPIVTRLAEALSRLTKPVYARGVVLGGAVLLALGILMSQQLTIGDSERGVPELRPDSRYNQDAHYITNHFSIGVDVLTIIAESVPDACVQPEIMQRIDRFVFELGKTPGIQSVISLAGVVKVINAGYNQGDPRWQVIPDNMASLSQTQTFLETSSGLFNRNCSAMPVYVFLEDHRSQTIDTIIEKVEALLEQDYPKLEFKLASGNAGVMAAVNDSVKAAQMPLLWYVFGAIFLLCWLTFRSFKGTLCVTIPLLVVSFLLNLVMVQLNIGLKPSTLPIVALGVGIGVDYGIYIFTRLQHFMRQGLPLKAAYVSAVEDTGKAVVFTACTLAAGVSTWILSPLQFQADMGVLLMFMFLVNMAAALLMIPALARILSLKSAVKNRPLTAKTLGSES